MGWRMWFGPKSCKPTSLMDIGQQADWIRPMLPVKEPERRRRSKAITAELTKSAVQCVAALAPPIVLEIGAHEASFSRCVKSLLPGSRTVAFEPNPVVFDKYCRTATDGGVEYLPLCISDRTGRAQFIMPHTKDGAPKLSMGSLLIDTEARRLSKLEVETTTIDSLLGGQASQPNAIWIDVEGAVGVVLDGATHTLRSCLLLYAEVETRQRWKEQSMDEEIIGRLGDAGFVPVLRDMQRPWQYNCLFIRKEMLANPAIIRACEGYFGRVNAL